MIGGEDEQVVVAQELQPARDALVDAAQRPGEAVEVVAVTVDLIGLDQVGEHEAVVEPGDQLGRLVQGPRVGRARMLDVDAHSREQLAHLADRVHGDAVALELLQIAAHRWGQRVVPAAVGALEGAVRAGERPRDDPAHGVLAGHPLADPPADRIELLRTDDVHVRRDLEHRVLAGVDDEVTVGEVLGAEILDRRQAVVGPVADHAAAAGGADDLDHVGSGKPSG